MTGEPRKFRVVKYARVSTDDQAAEDRFSIDAQISEMDEFIERQGWTSVGEFIDRGVSGTKRYRPQLDAMIAMAPRPGFDILVVHELSRLSRSVFDTLELFQIFGQHGIGFASVKDPDFNFSDPTKRFFLVILSAINEYYINLLKLHTSKAKRQRAKEGLYNSSITPFGYSYTGNNPRVPPEIEPSESKAVLMAYENYATGRYSHQEIADLLSDAGYKPRPYMKKGEGRVQAATRFSKDSVADMLRNPFYTGKVPYRVKHGKYEELYPGSHEPIITQELWNACQKILLERKAAARSLQNEYKVYLLANLARCDICGRKLRSQCTHSGVQYYREMSGTRGYTDCPHASNGVRADIVEDQIAAIIKSIHLPEDWKEEILERLKDVDEINLVDQQRQRLEAEKRRLKEMRLRGDFDDDLEMYQGELSRIRRELDNLPTRDQLESLKASADLVTSLGETWDQAERVDQRDLLRLIFREVQIDVMSGRVVSVVPQAVMLPIFRQVEFLHEIEFGTFVLNWRPQTDLAQIKWPQLPAVTKLPEKPAALPFLITNPDTPKTGIRMAPSVSQALAMYRRTETDPEIVIQIETEKHPELPFDLRKWPIAVGEVMTWLEFSRRPDESVDVLISQFPFWDLSAAHKFKEAETLIEQVSQKLTPGGVWYFIDVLPLDMPSSWIFRYFPSIWQWTISNTYDMHSLFTRLQTYGFEPEGKRKVFYQPVSLGSALEIAHCKDGLPAIYQQEKLDEGIQLLKRDLAGRDPAYPIGSEVAMTEIWAQKKWAKELEGK